MAASAGNRRVTDDQIAALRSGTSDRFGDWPNPEDDQGAGHAPAFVVCPQLHLGGAIAGYRKQVRDGIEPTRANGAA